MADRYTYIRCTHIHKSVPEYIELHSQKSFPQNIYYVKATTHESNTFLLHLHQHTYIGHKTQDSSSTSTNTPSQDTGHRTLAEPHLPPPPPPPLIIKSDL